MNISKNTIDLLKNYSTINPSVYVKRGNVISTISPQKTIMSFCEVEETFPENFAIYELSRFLGVVSLFEDPSYEFMEEKVKIKSNMHSVSYRYAEPSMIITPPEKAIVLPEDNNTELSVSWSDIQKVMRGASILSKPQIRFSVQRSKIFMEAVDTKDASGDNYSIVVQEHGEDVDIKEMDYIFKIENMKLIEGDYQIALSPKGLARFKCVTKPITYFIALEAK
tara:strand:- start:1752 stop:2420 length:669 start_codon:yes stop_codon:yes gene_type:complete